MSKSELNAILRNDLVMFVQRAFQTLNPGTVYEHNWHIDAICHQLMRCYEGAINRLIITVPPRSLKSICATVAFSAFILGQDPTRSIISASYSAELTKQLSNDCRLVMTQPWYLSAFPQTRLSNIKNTETNFVTTNNGRRFSTSVGGTLTGVGADFIIIDDPLKASDDPTETTLNSTNAWFCSSVITRLNNQKTGCIILIMQRLHENDLAGYLLNQGGWEHLNLPAIAEEEQSIQTGDHTFLTRKPGDLLHEARLPREILLDLERQQGSYRFAAQYQQNPAPAGGGIIKWEWFDFYQHTITKKLSTDFIVQSWDTANSIKEHASYTVCTTWLCRKGRFYLLDVLRDRFEFPQLERLVLSHATRWKADMTLIERNACSLPLIQSIEQKHKDFNLKHLSPVADKDTRMQSETKIIADGLIALPEYATWLAAFKQELVQFPNSKFNDQVDSLSQFLFWARNYGPHHPSSQLIRSRFYGLGRR